MPKSQNVPTKVTVKQSSEPLDYQGLRNIVKLMIVEAIKRRMAEEREMERRNNNKQ